MYPRQCLLIALTLVGPSKCLKQIIQIKSQLAGGKPAGYLQAWLRTTTRDYCEQIQLAVGVGLQQGASE